MSTRLQRGVNTQDEQKVEMSTGKRGRVKAEAVGTRTQPRWSDINASMFGMFADVTFNIDQIVT